MRRKPLQLVLLLVLTCGHAKAAQLIPPDRTFVESWYSSGYQGEIPAPATIVNVRDFGALGNGVANDQPAIVAAINSLGTSPGVVYFPAGTYLITSGFSLKNNVVLRGERSGNTTIRTSGFVGPAVNINGSTVGSAQAVISGYTAHSSTLQITSAAGLARGDYVQISQTDDPLWGNSFGGDAGQILQIDSISGNSIIVTNPIRMDFKASLNPLLQKVNLVTNTGIENLRFTRDVAGTATTRNNQPTISYIYAGNNWFRGLEGTNCFGQDIGVRYSTRISGSGCYFHDAYEVDGGGSGYGIKLEFGFSGECRFENNIFRRLRHAMAIQAGANGNVFAYNYSREARWTEDIFGIDLPPAFDVALHGNFPFANLFEGNIVKYIQAENDSGNHGINGPNNTFVRNRTEDDGLRVTDNKCTNVNVVGNEIAGGSLSLQGSGNYSYGNNVNGTITPAGTTTLTDYSYYLTNDPSVLPPLPVYWNIPSPYPSIGYPLTFAAIKTNPAYARWLAGGNLTVGPPSLAKQPTNFTANAGSTATFSIQATGTPVAVYAWFRNGVLVPGQTTSNCTLVNVQPSDAGNYTALVTDGTPYSVRTAPATLTVIGGVTCTFGLSAPGTNVSVNGGTPLSFNVTASDNSCAWTVSDDAAWITNLFPTSTNGNATVTYSVAANASGLIRTGHVTAAGQTYTVTQDACAFTPPAIASTNVSVNGANLVSIPVTANGTACTWTASADAPWIKNLSPTSGTGSGGVTCSVDLNTSGSVRTGHVTAAGQTFTISQDTCAFNLPAGASTNIPPNGLGSLSFSLDANGTACTWTASADVPWITVLTPSSGAGDSLLSCSISINPNSTSRTGHITVAGLTYTLNQLGAVSSFNDGVPDWWRAVYFGTAGSTNPQSCATCDATGTGQNNLFKYVAGLDPTNSIAIFTTTITPVPGQPSQMNLIYGPIAEGRTYTSVFSLNLTSSVWNVVSPISGPVTNGNQITITDLNATGPAKFYHINISYP